MSRDGERARSCDPSSLKSLAGLGDLGHQGRCRLEVPVGIGDMGMPEISAEREDVAGYRVAIKRTPFKRSDRKAVAQIVDARSRLTGLAAEPDPARQLPEQGSRGLIGRWLPSVGNKEGIATGDEPQTERQIVIQCLACRRMKRNQAALFELRLGNDKPVFGDVAQTQRECFGYPHAGRGEQAE